MKIAITFDTTLKTIQKIHKKIRKEHIIGELETLESLRWP